MQATTRARQALNQIRQSGGPALVAHKEDVRKAIRQAFKEIRKEGVYARMNLMCCQTCAWAAISEVHPEDDYPVIFFHGQDDQNLKDSGYVYLGHDGNAGDVAVPILEKHGLKVTWDGTDRQRILVTHWDWV